MSIIKMTKDNINEVAELERLSFTHPWSKEDLLSSLESNANEFYISIKENKIVAYVGITIATDEGYILNIATHPSYRQQGIASSLVEYLVNLHKDTLAFITLEVRASNQKAINLYSKFGFENVGLRKSYYSNPKEDAILMTKYFNSKKE